MKYYKMIIRALVKITYSFITKVLSIIVFLTSFTFCFASMAFDEPITTDNRIKTYIFNESEVYRLLVHTGYQSSVEFARGEEVVTISVGDIYAWKVTPVGRRLFIKPLQANVHTNMTVLTNKRAYQFDLLSKDPDDNMDTELVYVLRFFYPEQMAQTP